MLTGRRRPGLSVAPLRKRVRGRAPGGLGIVFARAGHRKRQWKAGKVGPLGDRGATRRWGERLADGRRVRCPAELTSEWAGGGEHKKARHNRAGME